MDTRILQSKTIYQGRVFDIRQETVQLPNGRAVQLDIVAHRGAVTILPVDEKGQIWFVRQYRHPAGETILELPAGVIEAEESPEECARREVREETGMAADKLQKLGEFYLAPGYSTEYMYVFLAKDLHSSPLQQDEDEVLSVEKIPIERAYTLAQAGKFRDAKTLAALFLARPYFNGDPSPT
jgi:ADP-ribose pyrophosphatase